VEEIPNPGDFFLKQVPTFDMSVIVVRGKDGIIRAFHNVCRHRGNQLEQRERGQCSTFRCRFHGWAYGLDGSLAAVPDIKALIDSFCETYHVPYLHERSIIHTLAGPHNPFGRLLDIRLKGPHRTMSVGGNPTYEPYPVQALAYQYSAGPSVTSGGTDSQFELSKGLNETRAESWAIDVTAFFPNLIIVISSGMYFTHQMWPLGPDHVVWQMRGYLRGAVNAAQRFGQENAIVELRDAVLEDANTLERIHRAMRQGLVPDVLFHDHELGLRHHYHTVVNWVREHDPEM
jgi:phenylpropionate dioxygenase-like ring-hydroxylating dioxygenase large terminal subunit